MKWLGEAETVKQGAAATRSGALRRFGGSTDAREAEPATGTAARKTFRAAGTEQV